MLENQRFPLGAQLLAMCRYELSAVISGLELSVCKVGGSGTEGLKE